MDFSRRLVTWYLAHARDLPWRRTSDPYAIWVSEVMLQQTQVATVVPYFESFLARFPNREKLAGADEQAVLAVWQGLGYYRRAKNLHSASKQAAPSTAEGLAQLPGIGRYTSRAIASMAFGERVACVDGNVRRVICRFFGRDMTDRECESRSLDLMANANPGEWNQAVMELGAMVCLPKSPRCASCPLKTGCIAKSEGSQDSLPRPRAKCAVDSQRHLCVCPIAGGEAGIRRIPEGEWWASMWEFPRVKLDADESMEDGLLRLGFPNATLMGTHAHVVTKHQIRLSAYRCTSIRTENLRWMPLDALSALPMPAPQRRVAALLTESLC
ncbi:MAG: A/G-specific adenine glycosylase [Fimbriimonadales bacterium]